MGEIETVAKIEKWRRWRNWGIEKMGNGELMKIEKIAKTRGNGEIGKWRNREIENGENRQ